MTCTWHEVVVFSLIFIVRHIDTVSAIIHTLSKQSKDFLSGLPGSPSSVLTLRSQVDYTSVHMVRPWWKPFSCWDTHSSFLAEAWTGTAVVKTDVFILHFLRTGVGSDLIVLLLTIKVDCWPQEATWQGFCWVRWVAWFMVTSFLCPPPNLHTHMHKLRFA